MMNKVKTKIYLSKTINQCNSDNIEKVVTDLYKRFNTYRDMITDMYILKAERINQNHNEQRKKYYYDTCLNQTSKHRKKTQSELLEKIKLNI